MRETSFEPIENVQQQDIKILSMTPINLYKKNRTKFYIHLSSIENDSR